VSKSACCYGDDQHGLARPVVRLDPTLDKTLDKRYTNLRQRQANDSVSSSWPHQRVEAGPLTRRPPHKSDYSAIGRSLELAILFSTTGFQVPEDEEISPVSSLVSVSALLSAESTNWFLQVLMQGA